MKAKTSAYIKYAAVAILAAGSGIVKAQSVPCTISGGPGVYACAESKSPPDCSLYTLAYVGNQLVYNAGVPTGGSPVVGNQDTNNLQLPGFGLNFSKLNGNSGFNHGVFTNRWGTACGTLVDNGGDGQADELVMQMGGYAGRGGIPVITNFPLSVPPAQTPYWPLQILPSWTSYQGPLNFYTPVNPSGVSLSCGSDPVQLALEVDGKTNARGPGPCAISASIPTATFWGYAAMTLLLMFAGMRLLRKGGFGDDFNLRA